MVEIQKSALRTFKKDFLSLLQGTMEVKDRVCHKRPQLFARGQIFFAHVSIINRTRAKRLQNAVILTNFGLQFFGKQNRLH